jgi:hypothetical protein
VAGALAVALGGAAGLGLPAPALAAPGDAGARGVVVELAAEVADTVVIGADATIGEATAPPAGGTDSATLLAVDLAGAVGATAGGTVDEVTATRAVDGSSAAATITGLSLGLLGVDVLDATAITATVDCPVVGDQSAATTLTGLELFGAAVALTANGPAVTGSAAVVVPGLLGAELQASLTRVEEVTDDGAAAVAVLAELTLTGELAGEPVEIPVGTVILAEATCERPQGAPTASGITPDEGPQSGGQTVTITGSGFIPGGTEVTFDGVAATEVEVAGDGMSLTAVTPAGVVGPAAVVVTTFAGAAAPLAYTYLADGSDAEVDDLSPTSGPTTGGTTVTITGTGFTGATGVTFGGVAGTGFSVDDAGTTITVATPPNPAGPVPVELVFPGGTVAAGSFRYVGPAVGSIDPDQGPAAGGTLVTVTGTGFVAGQTSVVICDVVIPPEQVEVSADGTSLSFVTPACAPGTSAVVVVMPDGASAPVRFEFLGERLAATGDPLTGLLVAGAGLLATGAALLLVTWRVGRRAGLG